MTNETYTSSPNHRSGEPLRSWLEQTPTRDHDARAVLKLSAARDALRRLIAGGQLASGDVVAFGRLNSFCVAQWYEPLVELMRDPFIDPMVAELFEPLVKEV